MHSENQNTASPKNHLFLRAIGWIALLVWLLFHTRLFFEEVEDDVTGLANVRPLILVLLILLIVITFTAGVLRDLSRHSAASRAGVQIIPRGVRGLLIAAAVAGNASLSYWFVELISKNKDWVIEPKYVLLNWAITLVICLFLIFLFNSVSIGMIIANAFFILLSCVNYFVYAFRGIPFQIIDLTSIQTAANVAGGYKIVLTWQMVTAITVTFCICSFYMQAHLFHLFSRTWGKLLSRGLAVGTAALFYAVVFISPLFDMMHVEPYSWRPNDSYNSYGLETAFLAFAKISYPSRPDTYSEKHVEEIENAVLGKENSGTSGDVSDGTGKTTSAADGGNAGTAGSDNGAPENIIVIMNESFSDLERYPNVEVSTEAMPFLKSLKENTQSGPLMVSVQGGTTANTEYEFLTGNSMMLSPHSIPYTTYLQYNQYTVATTLEAQGYRAEAVHPYYPNGWRRNTNYPKLGFDDFRSLEAFETFPSTYVRGFVSDKTDVEYLINEVENKTPGEKLFLFNVTMQNHGGYTYDGADFTPTIHLMNYEGTASEQAEAEQYLTLINLTDQAMEELITYFSQSDEKTVILFFGDHQPSISPGFYEHALGKTQEEQTFEEQQEQYETWYCYWANYDIPEAEDKTMSPNYLGAHLMELCGLETTGYEDFLLDQMQEIPAMNAYGYLGTDGKQHVYGGDGESGAISDVLENYRCLMYNELRGGSHRNAGFFGISGSGS